MRPSVPAFLAVALVSLALTPEGADSGTATAAERAAPRTTVVTVVVRVEPATFSPNGDGRKDETTITAETDTPSPLEIEVLDRDGTVRRSWAGTASPGAPLQVVWDGRAEGGAPLPDEEYTVRARGTDPVLVGEGAATAWLDTQPPSFRWRRIRPKVVGARKRIRLAFEANDASGPLGVKVEAMGAEGPRGGMEAEVRPGRSRLTWRSGRLYPGTYEIRLRLNDAAGNAGSHGPFSFVVERPMRARMWSSVRGAGPRVALTIDDCHYARAWAQMLTTLRDRNAGATFFCPGQMIARNRGLARRTIREGHAIGAHGWDHAALTTQPYAGVERRLRLDAAALRRATGHTTAPYFRPPYGAVNGAVVRAAGQTSHPRVIMWDVDTSDWTSPGVGTIVSRTVRGAKRGSIILLHTKPQTAAALPAIISGLRDRGLEPVGLPELFAGRGGSKRRR